MLSEAPEGPLHGVPVAVKDMFALPWRAPRDGCVGEPLRDRCRRVDGLPAAARCRRGDRRRHEHARDGGRDRPATSPSTGPCATPWDTSRCGGGSSGGSGVGRRRAARGRRRRHRRRRLDPLPGRLLRRHRPQVHLGHGASGRLHARLRVDGRARPDEPRRRRRPAPRRRAARAPDREPPRERRFGIGVAPWFWDNLDPEVESACRAAIDALAGAGLETREVELEGAEHVIAATVIRLAARRPAVDQAGARRRGRPAAVADRAGAVEVQPAAAGRRPRARRPGPRAAAPLARARVRRRGRARLADGARAAAADRRPRASTSLAGRVPADYANVRQGGIGNLAGVPGDLGSLRPHRGRPPDRAFSCSRHGARTSGSSTSRSCSSRRRTGATWTGAAHRGGRAA